MTNPDAKPPTERGLYAIGAAGLALEAIVLMLAAPTVITLERGDVHWLRVGAMFVLAILLIIGAAVLRRPGGKQVGTVLQVLVIAGGIITWPLFIIGAAFGGIWLYWLRLWPRHGFDRSVKTEA
ncbi:MAG: DUF4233 domain-containing protein [Frankiaceae bacterium]|nr:DUF4233 domain-containing protein [Frankiaceae bacterium]MBV9870796.1 DUF4233 domain-containing protein [Frankiaceae bacterium]